MREDRVKEIEERLSAELSQEDYKQWRISDIAKLRLDAKYLLAEVRRLQSSKTTNIENVAVFDNRH
ncbi:MAG: hypothetical protein AB9836_04600 [Aminipila sp.]